MQYYRKYLFLKIAKTSLVTIKNRVISLGMITRRIMNSKGQTDSLGKALMCVYKPVTVL